jgi:hypothetical protein
MRQRRSRCYHCADIPFKGGHSGGCVVETTGVIEEGVYTTRCVIESVRIVSEREYSTRPVVAARRVTEERSRTDGCIFICGSGQTLPAPTAVLKLFVASAFSEKKPIAVL